MWSHHFFHENDLSCSLLSQGLAGIQAVNVPGVENVSVLQHSTGPKNFLYTAKNSIIFLNSQVDASELIVGHSSYLTLVNQILDQLELNTYYPVFYPSTPKCGTPKSK